LDISAGTSAFNSAALCDTYNLELNQFNLCTTVTNCSKAQIIKTINHDYLLKLLDTTDMLPQFIPNILNYLFQEYGEIDSKVLDDLTAALKSEH